MDFQAILNLLNGYIPASVIAAVFVCILLVYVSQAIADGFEKWIEERTGRQIKIFDHKKIWLSLFWCVVLSVSLATGGFILWQELFFYSFCILGGSSFFYNAFLKKFNMKEK